MNEKNLPLAIGLNLLFPGMGYLYMERYLTGILGCCVIFGMYWYVYPAIFTQSFLILWVSLNCIMAIDMVILSDKNKKSIIKESTKKCPFCAEFIKREAIACRFCGRELSAIDDNIGSNLSQIEEPISDTKLMEEYGITFDGASFAFNEYKYDKLSDAVNYAKKHKSARATY